MPIDLFSTSEQIQNSIIQKLKLADFVNFHQSSRKSFNAVKNLNTKFLVENSDTEDSGTDPVTFNFFYKNKSTFLEYFKWPGEGPRTAMSFDDFLKLPVRFGGIQANVLDTFCDDYCTDLIKLLQRTNSKIHRIAFERTNCSPEKFRQLVEMGNIKEITFAEPLSRDFLRRAAIRNMANVEMGYFISNAEILALDVTVFTIPYSNLTSATTNVMLKEILSGRREIQECYIFTKVKLDKKVVLNKIPISKMSKEDTIYFGVNNNNVYVLNIYISKTAEEQSIVSIKQVEHQQFAEKLRRELAGQGRS